MVVLYLSTGIRACSIVCFGVNRSLARLGTGGQIEIPSGGEGEWFVNDTFWGHVWLWGVTALAFFVVFLYQERHTGRAIVSKWAKAAFSKLGGHGPSARMRELQKQLGDLRAALLVERAKVASATARAIAAEQVCAGATGEQSDQTLIQRLRERGKEAVRQREGWERRALAAEAHVAQLANRGAKTNGTDAKFEELRRYLAREFHPDHVVGDGLEKMFRAEVFKKIWPKIEEISGGR